MQLQKVSNIDTLSKLFGLARHRSRLEMIAAMLEAAAEESKPTEIMYRAYMSYEQFKEYLALVTARKLVEYNSTRKTYKITAMGKEFLTKSEKLKL